MNPTMFILGPSRWRDPHRPWDMDLTPMEARRAMRFALEDLGLDAFLMEDEPSPEGEMWMDKFYRLLHEKKVTHILFYWPPRSRIDAAEDELVMLAAKRRFDPFAKAELVLFGHPDAVKDRVGEKEAFLDVTDEVGRSSYLGQVPRMFPTEVHEWKTHGGLLRQVQEWAKGMFPDVIHDERLESDLEPLQRVLLKIRDESDP